MKQLFILTILAIFAGCESKEEGKLIETEKQDLSGYATVEYVDTQVAAATGVDLSNYYQKNEVDVVINALDADLTAAEGNIAINTSTLSGKADQTDLDTANANISSNTAAITSNDVDILQNYNDITTNQSAIAANTSAIAGKADQADLDTANSNISTNTAAITALETLKPCIEWEEITGDGVKFAESGYKYRVLVPQAGSTPTPARMALVECRIGEGGRCTAAAFRDLNSGITVRSFYSLNNVSDVDELWLPDGSTTATVFTRPISQIWRKKECFTTP